MTRKQHEEAYAKEEQLPTLTGDPEYQRLKGELADAEEHYRSAHAESLTQSTSAWQTSSPKGATDTPLKPERVVSGSLPDGPSLPLG